MTRKMQRKASIAAVTLALAASTAVAMTPLDQSGRASWSSETSSSSTGMGYDKAGGEVRSRSFDSTRVLEQSGRGGPSIGAETDSHAAAGAAIDEQIAATQDSHAWPVSGNEAADAGNSTAALSSEAVATAVEDEKIVVIVPSTWEGSLPDLLSAVEQNADDKPVMVVETATWTGGEQPGVSNVD